MAKQSNTSRWPSVPVTRRYTRQPHGRSHGTSTRQSGLTERPNASHPPRGRNSPSCRGTDAVIIARHEFICRRSVSQMGRRPRHLSACAGRAERGYGRPRRWLRSATPLATVGHAAGHGPPGVPGPAASRRPTIRRSGVDITGASSQRGTVPSRPRCRRESHGPAATGDCREKPLHSLRHGMTDWEKACNRQCNTTSRHVELP